MNLEVDMFVMKGLRPHEPSLSPVSHGRVGFDGQQRENITSENHWRQLVHNVHPLIPMCTAVCRMCTMGSRTENKESYFTKENNRKDSV